MSHILLKQVPTSAITAPASTDVKFFSNFNDGGLLYYMDSSGNPMPVGSGGGGSTYVPVVSTTYASLYSLCTSSGFATGSYYLINDFESIYEQPDFYCDGTPKSSLDLKGKPSGWGYQPILVMATSKNSLSIDAYQPPITGGSYYGFNNDKIKYDFSFNKTEFNNNTKGRITERIDQFGNRTDYDHRAIRFKRYQNYTKNTIKSGIIDSYNCTTGDLTGVGTFFLSELSANDIIIIDSMSDLGYNIGLKVRSVTNDVMATVFIDSLYSGGVPSVVALNSGTTITPVDYSFGGKNYDYYSTTATGVYNQYKEVYFGQGDNNDCNKEVYTFQLSYPNLTSGATNNKIGNYSQIYLSGSTNNVFILPNNVFGSSCNNNVILDNCYNNHIGDGFFDNNLGYNFSKNLIGDNFSKNTTIDTFSSNIISDNFIWNIIQTGISTYDFTSSTHVYSNYTCYMFSNSSGFSRLSYYDPSDVLTIGNVDA